MSTDTERNNLEDVHRYLTGTKWHLSEQGTRISMTWLEMLIHFEVEGWRTRCTEEGRARELEDAKNSGDKRVKKWQNHKSKGGNKLRSRPEDARNQATIAEEVEDFLKQSGTE